MSLRRAALPLALAAAAALPALAHGLHGSEGRVTVGAGRLTVEGEDLAGHLVLRDGAGRRLAPGPLPGLPGWLVLQMGPHDGAPRRVALAVRTPAGHRVATLTSGGNVALVRVLPAPEPACGDGRLESEEGLQEVRARLRRDGDARLEVDLPLGLLESFVPVERAQADVLSVAEQQEAAPQVGALVAGRLGLAGATVRFVGPDGEEGPLGAWTARARVAGSLAGEPLRWGLFNARVLRARVEVVEGGRCDRREVSTYRPALEPDR